MKKGFTLIELIIYMGIFSILVFIFTDIFVSSIQTKTEGEATSSVNQDANFILTKLEYDLNNATSVVQPILGQNSGTLTFIQSGQQVVYQVTDGVLERVVNSEAIALNSYQSNLSNAVFRNVGNPSGKSTINVNLTIESKQLSNNQPEVINLETTVGTR